MTGTLAAIDQTIDAGQLDEARKALKGVPEDEANRADVLFLKGRLLEADHNRESAWQQYQLVLDLDPGHVPACFRAGLLADQAGDDDTALDLFERCLEEQPAHVNALLNLAIIYEERGQLRNAESCLRRVLAEYPEHHRARQFLKSVESSYTMVYDEQRRRDSEQRHAILDQPISDFELSVRSRNCLRQMNIRTLGDLLKVSESELLSYKNFGETSLTEIKSLLTQKGLSLGQTLTTVPAKPAVRATAPFTGDNAVVLNKPVTDLELSVRSRKCLQWLGVNTLGELVTHSEAELMAIKNFGQTSLNEIRNQLAQHGLSFRPSR
ncbi:MAG: tetratricopeptide repeat protein [Phycisphaerae bacterium]|nr:tetratricopeptide repeat protein [Phycisphaerae bacterium]